MVGDMKGRPQTRAIATTAMSLMTSPWIESMPTKGVRLSAHRRSKQSGRSVLSTAQTRTQSKQSKGVDITSTTDKHRYWNPFSTTTLIIRTHKPSTDWRSSCGRPHTKYRSGSRIGGPSSGGAHPRGSHHLKTSTLPSVMWDNCHSFEYVFEKTRYNIFFVIHSNAWLEFRR